MTRLSEVKGQVVALKRRLSDTEIAATLALRSKPDHVERVKDTAGTKGAHYVVKAYGLARADGGYVTVCFRCPGQTDSYHFERFDDWADHVRLNRGIDSLFTSAVGRINLTRSRLLRERHHEVTNV